MLMCALGVFMCTRFVTAAAIVFGAFENPLRCALPRSTIESDLKAIYQDWKDIAHRFRNQPGMLVRGGCYTYVSNAECVHALKGLALPRESLR